MRLKIVQVPDFSDFLLISKLLVLNINIVTSPTIVTCRQGMVVGGYSTYCYEHQPTLSCGTFRFVLMRSEGLHHNVDMWE